MNRLTYVKWLARPLGAILIGLACLPAIAADGMSELKSAYSRAIEGKKIAFLPMSLGAPLMDTWEYVIRTEAARNKMIYSVKDPAWNSTALAQAVEGALADKPDIIVVQNPNVQLLTKQITRAKELVFSGRFVGAEEALELGLVDELVAPDGVYDAAASWAGRYVDAPSEAMSAAKELINSAPMDAAAQTRRYGEVFAARPGQLGCPA
jgi:hypothetical protein